MNAFQYVNGRLQAEDVPLEAIADEFDTPTFIYSRSAIVEAYRNFENAFTGKDHLICYAVKANSNLGVLGLLASLGAGFDIVSGGELHRVLDAGGDPAKVVFSGVGKQNWEINAALKANIACFNLESASELRVLNRLAANLNTSARISVRVNPNVDPKTHPYIATGLKESKFGVSAGEAMVIYLEANKLPNIEVIGIDFHIGSQIVELSPFSDALMRILELVDELEKTDIRLSHIDVGGGIGITYKDEQPVDVAEYAACILQILGNRSHRLLCEPGRHIVGNAGILLTRITTIKQNEGKKFAIVDAAMNDLIRPALYQSWQDIKCVVTSNQSAPNAAKYDVVGPVCESSDFLGRDRELEINEGDLLAIFSAGAYGFTMSSNYNSRNRAAEVIVSGGTVHCVRKRETIADQVRLETTLPDNLH